MTKKNKSTAAEEIEETSVESEEAVEAETEAEGEENDAPSDRYVVFEEALEAILFAAGHPVTYATLGRVFEMTPAKVKEKVYE